MGLQRDNGGLMLGPQLILLLLGLLPPSGLLLEDGAGCGHVARRGFGFCPTRGLLVQVLEKGPLVCVVGCGREGRGDEEEEEEEQKDRWTDKS